MRSAAILGYVLIVSTFIVLLSIVQLMNLNSWFSVIAATISVLSAYKWRAHMQSLIVACMIGTITWAFPAVLLYLIAERADMPEPLSHVFQSMLWWKMLAPIFVAALTTEVMKRF